VLTASEKRFIKSWEDQRIGGKVKYCLLYIIMGTIVAIIVLSFLSLMLSMGFPGNMKWVIPGSFIIITIATIVSWQQNEKKFKAIIQREIKLGMERDELNG